MKIELPVSVRFLDFQPYQPDTPLPPGSGLHVWVDPPRAFLREYDQINRDFAALLNKGAGKPPRKPSFVDLLSARRKLARQAPIEAYHRRIYAWYARLWSQGPDDTRWSADELAEMDEHNPAFFDWLCRSSWNLIEQHRADIKKGWRPPEPTPPAPDDRATPS